jgi:hypothetical protein
MNLDNWRTEIKEEMLCPFLKYEIPFRLDSLITAFINEIIVIILLQQYKLAFKGMKLLFVHEHFSLLIMFCVII